MCHLDQMQAACYHGYLVVRQHWDCWWKPAVASKGAFIPFDPLPWISIISFFLIMLLWKTKWKTHASWIHTSRRMKANWTITLISCVWMKLIPLGVSISRDRFIKPQWKHRFGSICTWAALNYCTFVIWGLWFPSRAHHLVLLCWLLPAHTGTLQEHRCGEDMCRDDTCFKNDQRCRHRCDSWFYVVCVRLMNT